MLTTEEIQQIRQAIKEENEPINKKLDNQQEQIDGQGKKLDNLTSINQKLDSQGKQLDNLTSEVSHINTVLKTVVTKDVIEIAVEKSKVEIMSKMATKQDLEEAKAEIKVDIHNLDTKFANKVQNHEKNIKALREATNTADPTLH